MIELRKAEERGLTKLSWLESYHSFSFGEYEDPQHINFRSLRVLNEDTVQPGKGFDTHFHRDAEIITYVMEGTLFHEDSMGNKGKIVPGMIQTMSAGKGIMHSEYNASFKEPVHFLQIWITPKIKSVTPQYQQKTLYMEEFRDQLCLLVSASGKDGSLTINQDAKIFLCDLHKGKKVSHVFDRGNDGWLQMIKGVCGVGNTVVKEGDGLAISQESKVTIEAAKDSEFLFFELA